MTVQLEVSANSTSKREIGTTNESGGSGSGGWGPWKVEVHGSLSQEVKVNHSMGKSSDYQISVHASQQPTTQGMDQLMALLSSTIQPIPAQTK